MVRTKSTVPHPVLEKMRYSNAAQFVDRPTQCSGKTPEAAQSPKSFKPKVPPKRNRAKRITPLPGLKPDTTREAVPLVFSKQEPIRVQVRRQEYPDMFERMAFVIRACSKETQHRALMGLHVEHIREGSWLVASDGKRLHAALIPATIESGDYKPVITKDAISLGEPIKGIVFPDWRRVIPGDTLQRGVIDLADSGWGKDSNQTERLSVVFNAFVRQTGEIINLRYLEDLAKRKWSIHCQREKCRAIMLKAEGVREDMFAVIIPLAEETVAKAA